MPFTQDLKSKYSASWEAATRHEFTRELGRGTLSADRFRRYFLQDYVFVNDLVKVAGIAVSKAPALSLARPVEEFLHAILGAEDDLFVEAFATLGIPESEYLEVEALPTTTTLGNYLVRLAYEGSFSHICAAIYVTEGVYLDWGEALKRSGADPAAGNSTLGSFYQGWIDLHTEKTLGEIVSFLGGVVDVAPPADRPKIERIFEQTLRYELAFWEMSYNGESWP